jgi:predicted DNA binding CopG/RHH family protein
MATKGKIEGTAEAWETGLLGNDERYAKVSTEVSLEDLEKSSGLKSISIRLQQSLIDDLKQIGSIEGISYQPLIKQVLKGFVEGEHKRYARKYMADQFIDASKDEYRAKEVGLNK